MTFILAHPYLIAAAVLLAWIFGGQSYGVYVERRRIVAYLRRAAEQLPKMPYREEGGQALARVADEVAGNRHGGFPSMGDREATSKPTLPIETHDIPTVAEAPPITSVPEPARPTSSKRPAPLPPIEAPGPREILE